MVVATDVCSFACFDLSQLSLTCKAVGVFCSNCLAPRQEWREEETDARSFLRSSSPASLQLFSQLQIQSKHHPAELQLHPRE